MKIIKNLLVSHEVTNQNRLKLNLINNFTLFFIGQLGVNYLMLHDFLFIKTLERSLFYNQFNNKNLILKRLLLNKARNVINGRFTELVIRGLGFRTKICSAGYLLLNLGYSHAFAVIIPKGLNILINKERILLFSADCQLLDFFSNHLLKLRPIDSYKGKGVYLASTKIKIKDGKKQKL